MIPVNLELLLLVDTSGSVSTAEYNLQKTGYVNAFMDPAIQAPIASFSAKGAVACAEWSSGNEQQLRVPWTQLTDAAGATAFANAIADLSTRPFSGSTALGSAINWGVPPFASNNFTGTYNTIDISGDGSQNNGANTFNAATAAWAAGISLDGLAVLGNESNLDTWSQTNIVTPDYGQLWTVAKLSDSSAFTAAVTTKIGQEVLNPGGVPEPGKRAMLGGGLALLAPWRRRLA